MCANATNFWAVNSASRQAVQPAVGRSGEIRGWAKSRLEGDRLPTEPDPGTHDRGVTVLVTETAAHPDGSEAPGDDQNRRPARVVGQLGHAVSPYTLRKSGARRRLLV